MTDVADLVQQLGPADADIVAITTGGTVFEIDPTGATAPVQRASGVVGQQAVAITTNSLSGGLVAIAANGHIYGGDAASNWASWPFLNDLGNNLSGVQDFVQVGIGVADFPVVRTVGGNLCWWDPRNHYTCTGSDLPGNVAAVGFNTADADVLVVMRDGTLYRRTDPPTFTMWAVAGSLLN